MNKIVKHDGNTIEGLTIKETQIVLAKASQRINEMANEELNKSIINIVNTIYAVAGQKASDEDMKAMCILLKNELKQYFGNISIKEIEIACSKGIRKEFGEYFGINIASINNWINKYITSEERMSSIKKYQALKSATNEKKELTDVEKEEIMLNSIERLKTYAKSPEFNIENFDFGNAAYDYLDAKGIINFTTAQKNDFMEIAKDHLKRDAINQKVKFEISPSGFNKIINMIEQQKSKPVVILAKKYALKSYFDSIKKEEKPKKTDDYTNPDYFNKF